MSETSTGTRRRSPAIVIAAVVLAAAAAFALWGPSADEDHIASGDRAGDGYGSDHEAATAPPQLGEIPGWIPGPRLDAPTERSCVTAPLDRLGPDAAELRSWTAVQGGDATVHLSVGGDPSATVAAIREAAATCPPQDVDGVAVHVVGVYPLAGIDGIEIRYGTDSAETPEVVSVWVANGQILAGATGVGVDDLDWATLLDGLAAASTDPAEDTATPAGAPVGGMAAG